MRELSIRHIHTTRFIYHSTRSVRSMNIRECQLSPSELCDGCRLGLDSHADTICVGRHAKILEVIEGQTVEAIPFAKSIGTVKDLPIVNAALAYDHPTNGQTYILICNKAIYLGEESDNCLLCPNQCRSHGIGISDVPPEYDESSSFDISIPDEELSFPLLRYGPTAYLRVRRPSELELAECTHIELSEDSTWDPYNEGDESSAFNFSLMESAVQSQNNARVFLDNILHTEHPIDRHIMWDAFGSSAASHRHINALRIKHGREATPERLSRLWGCSIPTAKRTLEATTHQAYREFCTSTGTLARRFRTRRNQLRYRQLSLPHGRFYTDTLFANVRSIRGYTCAQIYCNSLWFVKPYFMKSKSDAKDSVYLFQQDVGVPPALHSDGAPELTKGEFAKRHRRQGTRLTHTEKGRHNQNRAELCIREVKKLTWRLMVKRNIPLRLWCYVMDHVSQILCLTASPLAALNGRTSYEHVMGHTPDISEYVEFTVWDWVWYWDDDESFPSERKRLGRWLGVAHKVGQGMCYYILTENAKEVVRSTVVQITDDEQQGDNLKRKQEYYTTTLESKIGNFRNAIVSPNPKGVTDGMSTQELYTFCLGLPSDFDSGIHEPADDTNNPSDTLSDEHVEREELDKWIGSRVRLPGKDGESTVLARVTSRKRDSSGNPIGTSNSNPILDTRIYVVEFPDGQHSEFAANVIAENIYSQVDDEGHNFSYFAEVIGHRSNDDAIPKSDGTHTLPSGQTRPVITTKGWEINVRWKDQSTSWVPLSDIKSSNPIEVAEYAVAHDIHTEPAFKWWVSHTLRKRDRMISKVESRFRQRKMKFGVVVPSTVEEAFALDKENGNEHWRKAIEKEMNKVEVAFHFTDEGEKPPPGYKKITCHLVFDVKFDLTRKARYVAGGHLTDPPTSMTYSSVVSRDSVRIILTIAALNDLNLLACDISNAYLHASTTEKLYFKAGHEWGEKQGRNVIIVRALYGLKTSGKQWQRHFAETLRYDMKYTPSLADDNVWYKKCTRPDGSSYYAYILCYVDDVVCVHHDPMDDMNFLRSEYPMKSDPSIPKMYLGTDISQFQYDLLQPPCWAMGSDSYVKEAVRVVQERLRQDDLKFKAPNKAPQSPFSDTSYRAELDTSQLCNDQQAQFFQNIIGMLRWIVELGRVDVLTETSILSRYLAQPRAGHLHQALHIFHYLSHHNRSRIALDPTPIKWRDDGAEAHLTPRARAREMKELYPDAIDEIPPDAPTPLGKAIQINMFVDADHANDRVTRRSQSGIIIFLGKAPIIWFSKRQNSVEASSFGSEFVAMRLAVKMLHALRYKLRMFGIPIDGEANVFCDHNSVVLNSSTPESTLKKKHHSISYHIVRQSVAMSALLIRHVISEQNIADLFTKVLPPHKRQFFTSKITV